MRRLAQGLQCSVLLPGDNCTCCRTITLSPVLSALGSAGPDFARATACLQPRKWRINTLVAHADAMLFCVQAAEKLSLQSPIGGQAYFITNDDPKLFWGFIGDLLEGLGYGRPCIHLPLLLVLIIAVILDWIIMPLVRPFTAWSSDLSVTRVNLSSCNRQLQCGKAKRDFGYQPKVSVPEAIKRTVAHFERLQAPSNGRSKRTQ